MCTCDGRLHPSSSDSLFCCSLLIRRPRESCSFGFMISMHEHRDPLTSYAVDDLSHDHLLSKVAARAHFYSSCSDCKERPFFFKWTTNDDKLPKEQADTLPFTPRSGTPEFDLCS
mmetsp:Transcript_35998/g.48664  ORF Transcript_35998/g.48664 Transcript_35998/m.48664 type:complete len:115 (+) Transcript_35998:1391-1735(+)